MMQGARRVNGRVLWANLGLLFWLSLFPFVIRWVGERGITSVPTAAFGVVLLMAAISYVVLETALIAVEGQELESPRRARHALQGMAQPAALRAWESRLRSSSRPTSRSRSMSPWPSCGWFPTAASSAA